MKSTSRVIEINFLSFFFLSAKNNIKRLMDTKNFLEPIRGCVLREEKKAFNQLRRKLLHKVEVIRTRRQQNIDSARVIVFVAEARAAVLR